MKAIEIQGEFGLENLKVAEKEQPQPGHKEVLVKMKAVSLNFRDLLMIRGHYNPRQPLPLIPCSDGAGEIAACGEGVTQFKVGDSVASAFFQNWDSGQATIDKGSTTLGGPVSGTLAEYVILKENGVVAIPEGYTFEEAATLPCAALTAWNSLVNEGNVKAGDNVLIQGTGGVALFALQFAKILGAKVFMISSSDEKLAKVKEMGADYTVNYKTNPDWGKEIRKASGGIDLVVELGGAGTLPQSFKACHPGATIALIGVLSGVVSDLNILPIIMQNLHVKGIFVGTREGFLQMNRAISQHKIKPVIDKVFPFEQAKDALEYMATGAHFGKICISI